MSNKGTHPIIASKQFIKFSTFALEGGALAYGIFIDDKSTVQFEGKNVIDMPARSIWELEVLQRSASTEFSKNSCSLGRHVSQNTNFKRF